VLDIAPEFRIPRELRGLAFSKPVSSPGWWHICNNCAESLEAFNFSGLASTEALHIKTSRNSLSELLNNPSLREAPGHSEFARLRGEGLLQHVALARTLVPGPRTLKVLANMTSEHPLEGYFNVGLHFRTTDAFFKRKARSSRTNPRALPEFVSKAEQLHASLPEASRAAHPRGLRVFLCTDNPLVREKLVELLQGRGVAWFDASRFAPPPAHIRHNVDQTRTFADWFMLTKMSAIVASRSGFSETAARFACLDISIFNYGRFHDHLGGRGLCRPETDLRWI
jgi:hypothetical protein